MDGRSPGSTIVRLALAAIVGVAVGVHARSGVACADCHMPYVRVGAQKISFRPTESFSGPRVSEHPAAAPK